MIAGPGAALSAEPTDSVSLLRLLAEATDTRSFLATLRAALPRLLPATRVDLLTNDRPDGEHLSLAWGGEVDPPPHAVQSAASFGEWLASHGYATVSTLPLTGAGQHLGWLALARQRKPLGPGALALAGQLAAMIALRLLYERCRDDLAARDEQAALVERRQREDEEARLRATLAIGTAHDIGNLFASVMGHAQILEREAPAALQHDLRTIVLAASDGHQLLRRMLALKIAAAPRPPAPVVMLPSIVDEALDLTRPFWEHRPGVVVRSALSGVPAVRAYAAELREVLVNLMMNALAAMPDGGTLTLSSFVADGRVVIEVSDTGHGIAREHQGAIFQLFTTMREDGVGVGLSVSRAIVEGYGGTLTVHSSPGQGTTFALALPAIRAHDPAYELSEAAAYSRAVS